MSHIPPAKKQQQELPYVGRFAPSPTGRLHLGSLVSAVGSWLDSRANNGRWLLRIEDLDPPRAESGAAESFARDLDALGLHWDGAVTRQSERLKLYDEALQRLIDNGLAYRCDCSRRDIRQAGKQSNLPEHVYAGTCLRTQPGADARVGYRLNLAACTVQPFIEFDDRVLGAQCENVAQQTGDFLLRRRDGLHAYQLAVVVDDELQSVTDVVRGADLLDNTPRQRLLQGALAYRTLRYAHLPVVLNEAGDKLSKQTGAHPLVLSKPGTALCSALLFLGYDLPDTLRQEKPAEILRWALPLWPTKMSVLARQ